MQYARVDNFDSRPPFPGTARERDEILALLAEVDLSEALADFPHKGFVQDATGEWCEVGGGAKVHLGIRDRNVSIARLRDRAYEVHGRKRIG